MYSRSDKYVCSSQLQQSILYTDAVVIADDVEDGVADAVATELDADAATVALEPPYADAVVAVLPEPPPLVLVPSLELSEAVAA